jgi:dipeptidyl aminopeptidase/acylaminoacyl peptidase
MPAEFGRPQWALGTSMWAFADESHLVASYGIADRYRLAIIDLSNGQCRTVSDEIEPADTVAATATHAVIVGGSTTEHDAVVRVDLATGALEWIRSASTSGVEAAFVSSFLSTPEAIEFPTTNGLTAHMFYYAPRNPSSAAPSGELPPLIVVCHGGPTGSASSRFNPEIQYFTSRGFAVADVNYGGSAGFGRAYRERLKGQWGIVDVDDCVNAALHLVGQGVADERRLIVRGRSAGGYTTLAALTLRPGVFAAGASYYGVSDPAQLATATHKFESRYLDGLIGPYPESRELYWSRSPSHHLENLSCPVIFFHGLEDRVVPPSQSQAMADALRAKGIPSALLAFEGEQHGFRRAETIEQCLEAELSFYGNVFGFTPSL